MTRKYHNAIVRNMCVTSALYISNLISGMFDNTKTFGVGHEACLPESSDYKRVDLQSPSLFFLGINRVSFRTGNIKSH